MATTNRSVAKAAIKSPTGDSDDPELSGALAQAGDFRVELEKEANRHIEKMARGERGYFGLALGGVNSAPLNIAFLALTFGTIAWIWCLSKANGADQAFWSQQADRALALAGTALGYVFGQKGSTKA